ADATPGYIIPAQFDDRVAPALAAAVATQAHLAGVPRPSPSPPPPPPPPPPLAPSAPPSATPSGLGGPPGTFLHTRGHTDRGQSHSPAAPVTLVRSSRLAPSVPLTPSSPVASIRLILSGVKV